MICRMNRNAPLAALIHQLNPVVRGWCAHFRPGVSSRTFAYLWRGALCLTPRLSSSQPPRPGRPDILVAAHRQAGGGPDVLITGMVSLVTSPRSLVSSSTTSNASET